MSELVFVETHFLFLDLIMSSFWIGAMHGFLVVKNLKLLGVLDPPSYSCTH